MNWTEEQIDQMEEKFAEFQDKNSKGLLKWNIRDGSMQFDDNLKEQEYWELSFKNEYSKDIHIHDKDLYLVANIHAYIFYVTGKVMLGSKEYPDRQHYLKLL